MVTPDWYIEDRLRRAYFDDAEVGWVIDLGDGTCRLVNSPLGTIDVEWGDRVPLIEITKGSHAGGYKIGDTVLEYWLGQLDDLEW